MPALEKKWLINETTVETICLLSQVAHGDGVSGSFK